MPSRRLLLAAALCAAVGASASTAAGGALAAPSAMAEQMVTIGYRVSEQNADVVLARVTAPIEQALKPLSRVTTLTSSSTHGAVTIDVGFEGGATAADLASVRALLEAIVLEPGIAVIARTVELRAPTS